jgi:ABC-type multidrug transport system fused ATPase/permease subunit
MWIKRALKFGLSYKSIFIILSLTLFSAITEVFGIGIFLPIFQFIKTDGNIPLLVEQSQIWGYIVKMFLYFDIRVSLIYLLIISFSFFLSRQFFSYIRIIYRSAISQLLIKNLRDKMFESYLYANTSFHDDMPVGDLVNAMTTEVNNAISGVMSPLDLIAYVVMALGYLVILFLLSIEMTVASLVILVIASLIPKLWIQLSAKVGRKLVDANTSMSSFLVGRLKSPRLVRLSSTELAEINEFNNMTQLQRKHAVHGAILSAKTEVVMEPIVIAMSLIFIYVSYTVLDMQIELIGLYIVVILRLLPSVKGIIIQYQAVQRLVGSIEVVEDRLQNMISEVEYDIGKKKIKDFDKIKFKNILYRYPGANEDAIKNISITISSGSVVALVGPSGSGKSTFIDLLPRLRKPTMGKIYLDNELIEQYSLQSIRQLISYAPQNPQLFNGTIKEHIKLGNKHATDIEVKNAAYLSGAEEFINNSKNGYETIVGEDGVKLSGGQKQRLDLARALISNSSILILDEPTSNLDVESEEKFNNSLDKIHNETDTTIIIVTHSLSGISNADNIVIFNNGVVENQGTHDELLMQDGWYSKAWKLQT